MEAGKKEKYILLNDDSDLEEYDKSKVGLITPGQKEGKKFSSKVRVQRRCSACCQPRWLCHTFFILLLMISQLVLSLFVLKLYWNLEDIKHGQPTKQRIASPGILNSQKSTLEKTEKSDNEELDSRLKSLNQQFKELNTSVMGIMDHMNEGTENENTPVSQGLESLAKNIKFIENNVSDMNSKMKILQSELKELKGNHDGDVPKDQEPNRRLESLYNRTTAVSIQIMKGEILQLEDLMSNLSQQLITLENSESAQLATMQDQLNNVTQAVNNLQGQLVQGLDTAFGQISQLRDEIYLSENAPVNHTDQEDSDISTTTNSTASSFSQVKDDLTTPAGSLTPSLPAITNQDHRDLYETDVSDGDIPGQTSFTEHSSGMLASTPEELPTLSTEMVSQKYDISGGNYRLKVPSIKRLSDLQSFFYGADKDANGYLSYSEIVDFLEEEAPQKDELEQFDEDHDDMYSYLELLKAFALEE